MIGRRIEPRTLSTLVARPRCLEGVWAAVRDIDELVCSIETKWWQTSVGAVDGYHWGSVWWLDGALLQVGEFAAQCGVQLHELGECRD